MTTAIAKLFLIDRLMVLTQSFSIAVDFVPRTDYTRFLTGRPNQVFVWPTCIDGESGWFAASHPYLLGVLRGPTRGGCRYISVTARLTFPSSR
jgi:hypothetical protein